MMSITFYKQKNIFALLGFILTLACSGGDYKAEINAHVNDSSEKIFEGTTEAEANITKAGGGVNIAEAKAVIPDGSSSSETKVSLTKVKTGYSEASQDERLAVSWKVKKGSLNKETTIAMKVDTLTNEPWVKIAVYDANGKELKNLVSGTDRTISKTTSGKYWITFDTTETDAVFVVIDPEPIDTTLIINDGALFTKESQVEISVSASSSAYISRTIKEVSDCSTETLLPEKTSLFSFTLSNGDGKKDLCSAFKNYWGDVATGQASIVLDTTPPSTMTITSGPINADYTPGASSLIKGNAEDVTSGVAKVNISISNDGGQNCLNAQLKAFTSPCPVWLTPEGLEDWSLSLDDALLVDGTTYSVYSLGIDHAENAMAQAALGSFVWDITPPVAALNDVPQDINRIVNTDIDVLADTGLVAYRFKFGKSADINCQVASGYSSEFIPENINIKLSLSDIPDGSIKLCVVGKDAAGNIQPFTTATASLWVKDTIPPTVEAGDSVSARVLTALDATVYDINAVTYLWTKKNGVGTITFSDPNAEDTSISAVGDGFYEILLTATDAAGNSAADSLFLTWDTTPPNSAFRINSDALFTKISTVSLSLVQSADVVAFRRANGSDCSGATWEDLGALPISHTLTAGDGLKTVCFEVKDAVGNISSTTTKTITLDTILPLSVNGVAGVLSPESTAGAQTKLVGSVTESGSGVETIYASLKNETSGFCLNTAQDQFIVACPNWLVAEKVSGWSVTIADSILVDGTNYTLESKALDKAGNMQTPVESSGFAWDASAPDSAFQINGIANYTKNATVDIDVTTPAEIAMYRINSGSDCSGATWQTFAGSPISFILEGTDGSKTVCLQVKDAVDNVSTVSTDAITLDTEVPGSSIITQGTLGVGSTAGNMTDFSVAASDTLSLIDKVYLSVKEGAALCLNDDLITFDAACPHWLQMTETTDWTLSIADTTFSDGTTYTLASKAVDFAANDQIYFGSATVTWDGTPPSPSFFINADNAAYTISPSVALILSFPNGVARYRAANGADCSAESWLDYTANNIPFTLVGGEGLRTVCLEVQDSVGNNSSTVTDTITLDTTPPTSVSNIPSTLGPLSTPGNTTILSGTASDSLSGVAGISLSIRDGNSFYLKSNGSAFDSVSPVWLNASGLESWAYTLNDGILTNGMTYQISIKGTDNLGNTESPTVDTNFVWDSAAPSSDFTINGGGISFTKTTGVSIDLVDATGVAMYRIIEGSDFSSEAWQAYSPITFALSSGDGLKEVCLQVKDDMGNTSAMTTKTITLDATPPSSSITTSGFQGPESWAGPQISIVGSAIDTGGSLVNLVNVSIEEITSGKCLNDLKSAFTVTCPYWHQASGKTSWSLLLDDSIFTNNSSYNIKSLAIDTATNIQVGFGTSTISWDTVAPSSSFVINADAAYTNGMAVSLTLNNVSGISHYRKANGADCSGASWVVYTANPIAHTLTTSQGLQTVCMEAKDLAGNVSASTDTITYDNLPPNVNVGPDITTNDVPSINAISSDANTMTYSWSKQSGPGTVTFGSQSAEDTTVATSADGTYVIRLTVTDAAGNSAFDDLTLVKDSSPILTTFANAPVGRSNIPSLAVSVAGTNITHYKYKLGLTSSTNCSLSSGYGSEIAVSNLISDDLTSFADGSLTLCVIGKNNLGVWQLYADALTATWTKTMQYQSLVLTAPAADYFCVGQNSYTVSGYCRYNSNKVYITGAMTSTDADCINHAFSKLIDLSSVPDGEFAINFRHGQDGGEQGYMEMIGVKNTTETYSNSVNFPAALSESTICRGATYMSGITVPTGVSSGTLNMTNGSATSNNNNVTVAPGDVPNPFNFSTDIGGATSVSGVISANTTWNANKRVTGTVTVNAGVTLTIDPGITIFIDNGQKILVHGTVNAVGTQANPIYVIGSTFAPATDILTGGSAGSSGTGFELSPFGTNSNFQYAVFGYLFNGIWANYNNTTHLIPQGTFTLTTTVKNSVFFDNSRGFYAESYPSRSPYSGWSITGTGNIDSNVFLSNYSSPARDLLASSQTRFGDGFSH